VAAHGRAEVSLAACASVATAASPPGSAPAALAVVAELPERPVVHLDAGYDYQPCRQALAEHSMASQIATRGKPAPVQVARRWPVERTHAWANQYGKLCWCTERCRVAVEFWLALASAAIVCGWLVRRGWTCYRWDSRLRRRLSLPTGRTLSCKYLTSST